MPKTSNDPRTRLQNKPTASGAMGRRARSLLAFLLPLPARLKQNTGVGRTKELEMNSPAPRTGLGGAGGGAF